jgi:NAD(P)-dependent dehydrogenase (short-subunit alcohol dehydrogenase family)
MASKTWFVTGTSTGRALTEALLAREDRVAAADTTPPARRLLLDSDGYEAVHASLTARLDEVDAQREHASITDHT